MHATATAHVAPSPRRLLAGVAALALLAAAIFEITTQGTGLWQFFAFGAARTSRSCSASARPRQGQLHPRAVGIYNALHRPVGARSLLAAAVAAGVLEHGVPRRRHRVGRAHRDRPRRRLRPAHTGWLPAR